MDEFRLFTITAAPRRRGAVGGYESGRPARCRADYDRRYLIGAVARKAARDARHAYLTQGLTPIDVMSYWSGDMPALTTARPQLWAPACDSPLSHIERAVTTRRFGEVRP